jgi:hypothetical protein
VLVHGFNGIVVADESFGHGLMEDPAHLRSTQFHHGSFALNTMNTNVHISSIELLISYT